MNSKTCLLDTVHWVLQKGSGCCSECFNGFSLFPGVYWNIDTVDSWNPSPVEKCLIHHLQGFTLDTPNTSKYYISQAIYLIVSLNITRVSLRTRQKHDVRSWELDGHCSTGVMTTWTQLCAARDWNLHQVDRATIWSNHPPGCFLYRIRISGYG